MHKIAIMRVMNDEEQYLWFLPPEPEDHASTDMPWPMANRASIFDPKAWAKAEGRAGRELAAASAVCARLDERLRLAPTGLLERLAMGEVEALLWAQGDRISAERIALYLRLREATMQDGQMLSAASWAVRRMLGQGMPEDLSTFLGRKTVPEDSLLDMASRPVGIEFEGLQNTWLTVLSDLDDVHPLTRAAAGFHAWRTFGLSDPGAVLEGAVAASKIGAAGNKALQFVPVALADRYALAQSGTPLERLLGWLKAVENAGLRSLMLLAQLENWRGRALDITAKFSGKTPPALIEVFIKSTVVSVAIAVEMTGVSKAAAQRNLTRFEDLGLIREVTGQGRYRFWTVVSSGV